VQAVEKAGDIHLLRAQALAGGGDDAGVQAQPLGGLDAGRCAGHAEAQLVVGRERDFVHAGRGVEHAGSVGGVDLERGVVGGDERPRARRARKWLAMATASAEPSSGSVEEPSSSSSTRDLVAGQAREAVEVGDVRGKGGERGLDGLRVADVGQKCREDRKAGGRGGDGQAGLRHHGQQRRGLERDGLAAGVGAADDELALGGGQLQRERDDTAAGGAQRRFSSSGWRAASRRRRSGAMAGATQS
jgi:hypothetical protein